MLAAQEAKAARAAEAARIAAQRKAARRVEVSAALRPCRECMAASCRGCARCAHSGRPAALLHALLQGFTTEDDEDE